MPDWSPELYLKYSGERSRPALDLLSHVAMPLASEIYDLGCGPGNSTALLLHRFPDAAVTGVDNSPAMLAEARKAAPQAQYVEADLRRWHPPAPADILFSNAALQWVPGHGKVMLRLLGFLRPGGALAVQMPDNLEEPSHILMRTVARSGPWKDKLADAETQRERLLSAAGYDDLLRPHCRKLQVWRTTYYHRLADHSAIVEFVSSTGLRPFLDPLEGSEQVAFRQAYEQELRSAYVALVDGSVLLPFPRIFIVAQA